MRTITFKIDARTIDDLIPLLKGITEYFEERKRERMIKPIFKTPEEDLFEESEDHKLFE